VGGVDGIERAAKDGHRPTQLPCPSTRLSPERASPARS
jgi:hypothetical protein